MWPPHLDVGGRVVGAGQEGGGGVVADTAGDGRRAAEEEMGDVAAVGLEEMRMRLRLA